MHSPLSTVLLILGLMILFITPVSLQAQTAANKIDQAYQIPFASSENLIELDVINTGTALISSVQIKSFEQPSWLKLDENINVIDSLAAAATGLAKFTFSVNQNAPIGEVETLSFRIISDGTVIGTKEFLLAVEAPKEAALLQNYPNPFNPATTIGYDLPFSSIVELRVFDMLGREVALLVDGEQTPGHHQVQWDASQFSSGTYFYLLKIQGPEGEYKTLNQKMILIK